MIAVADTSPVCYLIPIGEVDVLPPLAACGSLGSWVFLGEAATRGLLELASAIDRLRMTSFRGSPALLKTTLDRFGSR